MARSVFTFKYNDFTNTNNNINNFLVQNGFKKVVKNNEEFWKKGTGMVSAMQYLKFDFSESELTVYAWVQAGLGSFGGNEMDLTGFVAAVPKKSLMNKIEKLKNCLV